MAYYIYLLREAIVHLCKYFTYYEIKIKITELTAYVIKQT